jgi:hypothetical protein
VNGRGRSPAGDSEPDPPQVATSRNNAPSGPYGGDCEEEQEGVAVLAEAHLERLEAISAGLAEIIRQQARERSTTGLAPRSS